MNWTADSSAPSSEALRPRILILAGTTAVGKTEVSIPLARWMGAEIVSADSRQIFRELNVATAKPSDEQLAEVPHHFIGEKSIRDRWTAGDFSREARMRINGILGRNRTVLVVGGSMLYLRALLDGFYDDEEAEEAGYAELRRELSERGGDALYSELKTIDPRLAERTDPHDYHRILRGIAVYRSRGISLSVLQARGSEPIGLPFIMTFLWGDREQTYERVNRRAKAMIDAGLVNEVRALRSAGLDETNCNALRTHGYQEVFPCIRGEVTPERMLDDIQRAVRHYVKRQLTWFRRETRACWIERTFSEPAAEVAARVLEYYRAHGGKVADSSG